MREELFQGLKIYGLEQEWAEHPIFHIDFSKDNFNSNNPDILEEILQEYLNKWEQLYGKDPIYKTIGSRFKYILEQAEKKTGRKAVVLIDEYDKPLLDVLGEEQEIINRNILKSFYATFKISCFREENLIQ